MRQKQITSEKPPHLHENALNILFEKVEELVDLRVTSERNEEVILAKIVAAVRNEKIFYIVCQLNPTSLKS